MQLKAKLRRKAIQKRSPYGTVPSFGPPTLFIKPSLRSIRYAPDVNTADVFKIAAEAKTRRSVREGRSLMKLWEFLYTPRKTNSSRNGRVVTGLWGKGRAKILEKSRQQARVIEIGST